MPPSQKDFERGLANQEVGKVIEELAELDDLEGSPPERQPTHFELAGHEIAKTVHNPKTLDEKEIHSVVPKHIISNIALMNWLPKLSKFDNEELHKKNAIDEQTYEENKMHIEFMTKANESFLQTFMAVQGEDNRARMGERNIGHFATGEVAQQDLITGGSQMGLLRKIYKKFGGGK